MGAVAAFHESLIVRLQILVTLPVPRFMLQCVEPMIKHTAISVKWNVQLVSKRRTLQ